MSKKVTQPGLSYLAKVQALFLRKVSPVLSFIHSFIHISSNSCVPSRIHDTKWAPAAVFAAPGLGQAAYAAHLIDFSQHGSKIDTIFSPMWQIRKPRLRKANELAPSLLGGKLLRTESHSGQFISGIFILVHLLCVRTCAGQYESPGGPDSAPALEETPFWPERQVRAPDLTAGCD